MLTIYNLTFASHTKILFKNFGFSAFVGSYINIYGPNGSGKTCLLKFLIGLYKTNRGGVLYNNQDISQYFEDYSALISYIGHNNVLSLKFTVLENLYFWAKIYNKEMAIDAVIQTCKLEEYLHMPLYMLSKGWKRRVEISRILLENSILWFLDEPFANLDREGIELLSNIINIRLEQNAIVITTSHKPREQKNICNINIQDFISYN